MINKKILIYIINIVIYNITMPKKNIDNDDISNNEDNSDIESSFMSDEMSEEENSEITDYEDDDLDYDSDNNDMDDTETKQSEQTNINTSLSEDFIQNPERSIFYSDNKRNNIKIYVDDSERISKPILTKYEYVRILAERTKQIASGAKPMILNASELLKKLTPKEIAKIEIKNKTIPFIIIRDIGQNRYEKWKISELENFYE